MILHTTLHKCDSPIVLEFHCTVYALCYIPEPTSRQFQDILSSLLTACVDIIGQEATMSTSPSTAHFVSTWPDSMSTAMIEYAFGTHVPHMRRKRNDVKQTKIMLTVRQMHTYSQNSSTSCPHYSLILCISPVGMVSTSISYSLIIIIHWSL